MKIGLPLVENKVKPLARSVWMSLGVRAAASGTDRTIQKKIHKSGTTVLIILNKEMEDIMKIVKALEDSSLIIKCSSKIIKNEAKEQKGGFLTILLGRRER